MSLTVRDEEIKAEKEIADQKTKNLIKQILNPAPCYFADDEFILKDSNINDQKNTDNPFVLKPEVQKQLNDTVLKKFISPPAVEPKLAKPNQDSSDPPAFSIPPPFPELSIPKIVEPSPPNKPFIPPPVPESSPPTYEPPPSYEDPPPYIQLEDIFIDDEIVDQPKISLIPKTDETDGNVVEMSPDNKVEIKKPLGETDVQIKTEPISTTYISTELKKNRKRRLKKIGDHP